MVVELEDPLLELSLEVLAVQAVVVAVLELLIQFILDLEQ